MTWWCSADGLPWTWTWTPYPGVWLMMVALGAVYVKGASGLPLVDRPSPHQKKFFFTGLGVLWIAADWPVGALGAGYLLSVHQAQFVLFTMTAPALIILGTPPAVWRALLAKPVIRRVAPVLTRPLIAMAIFNVLVLGTHFPEVVDGLMPTQWGTFVLDLAWIVAGFALWWPVLNPVPEMNGLSYPGRFGFLLASIILPAAPAAFLIFASYPLYELYELSPPIGSLSAGEDQLLGGLIMKGGSAIAVFAAATILFFKWHGADGGDESNVVYKGQLPASGGGA